MTKDPVGRRLRQPLKSAPAPAGAGGGEKNWASRDPKAQVQNCKEQNQCLTIEKEQQNTDRQEGEELKLLKDKALAQELQEKENKLKGVNKKLSKQMRTWPATRGRTT